MATAEADIVSPAAGVSAVDEPHVEEASQVFRMVPLEHLVRSPTNPRKTFDDVKLQELARSVAEVGVLEPILVRRAWPENPNMNGRYQVVAGERRYRAAKLACVESVPCIVRELSDVQVLEIQTIENLQRDDLHPLEEAEGYAALMKQAGYDVAAIAQKISKSAKYVYDRIKLLQLIPGARKIFLDGEMTAGHAILLARLNSADQERAIEDPDGRGRYELGGLFQVDVAGEDDEPRLELDDERSPRKPVSVREFEKWINHNVRFRPEEVDLPNLFPETAAALAAAEEAELKVVKITHDYRVGDEARDEKERTYGRPSWKRADGEEDGDGIWAKRQKSKTCEHSVMGVVVAGVGRGQAFRVCVAKKKCKVHWAAEMKEAEQRKNGSGTTSTSGDSYEEKQRKYREQREREEADRKRWEKARPKLLEELAAKLTGTPALDLVDVVLKKCRPYGGPPPKQLDRGRTVEDALRYLAFVVVAGEISSVWDPGRQVPPALKPYGIDAKKIVDQVAPKPKPEKKKAEAPKKDGRKAAGARAAAKARKAKRVQTAAKSES